MDKKSVEDPFSLLKKYDIEVANYAIVKTKKELMEKAKAFSFPVVLKVWDKRFSHKTDIGGVILDIWNKDMLLSSFEHLKKKFSPSFYLLQEQVKRGIELYVGAKEDEIFGHMVLLGFGGIFVEVFKDITARVCPISREDVYEMVEELKAKKILLGYRGKPVNISALSSLLIKVGKLSINEKIKELDLNPVKIDEKGYKVLDVRIVR